MSENPPVVLHAAARLHDLVVEMRPDWASRDVRGVIAHAHTISLTWEQTVVGLVRLAVDVKAQPWELIPDRNDPTKPRRVDPAAAHRGAELARELRPDLFNRPEEAT